MLLANLLHTLSGEEVAKVRSEFRLPERSRMLFERIAGAANAPPDSESLAKAFRISTENLYRLFSEIVDECVRILAPKEDFATMKFFRSKYLYRPFVTEMQRVEKRLLQARDRAALEAFYEFVFKTLRDFPIQVLNLDLIEEYGSKWHSIKENPLPDDDLHIRLHIIYLRICSFPSRKKMTLAQMSATSRALLDPVAEQAKNSPNILARYYYFQAEWKACVYERDNAHAKIEWVRQALQIIRLDPSLFPPETEQTFELLIAYERAMTLGKVKEGLETYKKFFRGQTPENSRGALFLKRLGQIAFLAGDFATSRKVLAIFERYHVVKTTPGIYIIAVMMKAMLEIVDGSSECAMETLELARSINQENFFLATEVQIRGLDAAIALKRGDLTLADQLSERNIKWLRSRRISLATSAWIYYYQVIGSIVRFRMAGEPIRSGLLEHYHTDFNAEHPEFYLLIKSDLQAATANKK